eukprot:764851-Hanusia_phi.AAC.5
MREQTANAATTREEEERAEEEISMVLVVSTSVAVEENSSLMEEEGERTKGAGADLSTLRSIRSKEAYGVNSSDPQNP